MPHFRFEYSGNLTAEVDFDAFVGLLHRTLLATGAFELGAIRVRGFRADCWAVADRLEENAFVDMSLRMGEGRSHDERKRVGEALFAAATAFFAERLARPHFMLSLEIREIDAQFSWKKNAIHPRLRGAAPA